MHLRDEGTVDKSVSYISRVDEWHDLVKKFPLLLKFSETVGLVHQ